LCTEIDDKIATLLNRPLEFHRRWPVLRRHQLGYDRERRRSGKADGETGPTGE
jgi:hypothetical protein